MKHHTNGAQEREGPMEAIRTEALTRAFGGTRAVDGLCLTVDEGELFGIVGPDGAGKTTLLRLLSAVLDPTSGEAWVDGLHTVRDAEAVKERIGYMSQRFGLYPDLTVAENLDFYADLYGASRRARAEKAEQLLAFANLAPYRRRLAGNLSGGMKQKLGLMCALIHTPRILLLDEPTNGVDPVSRREFWRILHGLLQQRVTIVVSTSYLDEAERCRRVGFLHKGRLLAVGAPEEFRGRVRESILEIVTDNARGAAARLREQVPDLFAGLYGDRVHVRAADPEAAKARLTPILASAGIAVEEMRIVPPSLEDVFVSLLGGEPVSHVRSL